MTQLTVPESRVSADPIQAVMERLCALSRRGLRGMYRPDEEAFVFRVRPGERELVCEGLSPRYTAIVLIGLASEEGSTVEEILSGASGAVLCGRCVERAAGMSNLGDVALTLWAGLSWGMDGTDRLVQRVVELGPADGGHPTVELAWCLTALSVDATCYRAHEDLASRLADRLLRSFNPGTGVFSHQAAGSRGPWLRRHVACYADMVYPIQALSHYYARTGEDKALAAARRCAEQICTLQGTGGQWWWHYDVRTGDVVEGYPVYSVHQEAMGPMALFALSEVCGDSFDEWILRGVRWMLAVPELCSEETAGAERESVLIDDDLAVIWRKVGRREPGKAVRSVQALAGRMHRRLRAPGMNVLFPPIRIDYECRPYHLGWLLYAWSNRSLKA